MYIDYIKEMMVMAGVEPKSIAELGSTYSPDYFEVDGKYYPKFTPEKQLKLIKLASGIRRGNFGGYGWFGGLLDYELANSALYFNEVLAKLIIQRMSSNLDKQEVKRILEE